MNCKIEILLYVKSFLIRFQERQMTNLPNVIILEVWTLIAIRNKNGLHFTVGTYLIAKVIEFWHIDLQNEAKSRFYIKSRIYIKRPEDQIQNFLKLKCLNFTLYLDITFALCS